MSDPAQAPPRKSRLASRIALVVGGAILAWMIWTMLGGQHLPIGTPGPAWKLPLADGSGERLALEDLAGKVVVLDFWSITCAPCRRQLPELKELWRKLKPRGVVVIGITAGGETLAELSEFGRAHRLDYPVVLDERGTVAAAYEVRTLPTLYVLDRGGRITAAHNGFWPLTDLATAVNEALASGEQVSAR
jgi:peroxiredoxin